MFRGYLQWLAWHATRQNVPEADIHTQGTVGTAAVDQSRLIRSP